MEIRAFVSAFPVPQPPTGLEVVGYTHGPTTCLPFPKSWKLGVSTVGSPDTTYYTWTPGNSSGIFLFAVDSAIWATGGTPAQQDSAANNVWPFDNAAPGSFGFTPTFVPGSAVGWAVTFPTKSRTGVAEPGPTPALACTPQQ
jgi:hypothetical protein